MQGKYLLIFFTLEMMMPAMEILTLGPCSNLYLRSTPFQKEMTYLLMATLSSPCSLEQSDNHTCVFEIMNVSEKSHQVFCISSIFIQNFAKKNVKLPVTVVIHDDKNLRKYHVRSLTFLPENKIHIRLYSPHIWRLAITVTLTSYFDRV